MSKKPPHTALNPIKHGAYSNLGLLPGEDRNEFLQLHAQLCEEFTPSGPLEEDAVIDLAKLVWRKSKLGTYQRAQNAKRKWDKYLTDKDDPDFDLGIALKKHFLDTCAEATVLIEHVQEHGAVETKLISVVEEVQTKALALVNKDRSLADVNKDKVEFDDLFREHEGDIRLALLGDVVTLEHLNKEVELADRIDARIDRVLKRLMHLKAMKPMVGLGPTTAGPHRPERPPRA